MSYFLQLEDVLKQFTRRHIPKKSRVLFLYVSRVKHIVLLAALVDS